MGVVHFLAERNEEALEAFKLAKFAYLSRLDCLRNGDKSEGQKNLIYNGTYQVLWLQFQ